MLYGYGMGSHNLHKDGDGVGMIWERFRRSEKRQYAVKLGHISRLLSDICTFAQIRLLYVLLFCNGNREELEELSTRYISFFEELDTAQELFSAVEYNSENNI
jgi:hypothetical protein